MNKSKYGKLSIIIILIATLFVSAAIAIFGLSENGTTGANSSAEITAPENSASSAITEGETDDDGTIVNPEVEAKATAVTLSLSNGSSFDSTTLTNMFNASTEVQLTINGTVSFSGAFTVASGNTLRLIFGSSSARISLAQTSYFSVSGTLYAYGSSSSGGTIAGGGSSATRTNSAIRVMNNGNVYLCNTSGQNGVTLSSFARSSGNGGAVYVYSGGYLSFGNGSMISSCSATDGGGVYIASGGEMSVGAATGLILNNCTASANGGGIYNSGNLSISVSSIPTAVPYGNIAACKAGSGSYGGAIFNNGTFTFNSGRIVAAASGAASYGGAVYNNNSSTFNLRGGQIGYSNATYSIGASTGGGVYNAGTFNMSAGNITKCTSTANGGGVYNTGTFNMSGGTITGCEGSWGGAVCSGGSGSVTISGSAVITTNTARYHGAGVYAIGNNCTLTMTGGTVSNNTADDSAGGIMYEGGTITMSGGTITGNSSSANGGGLMMTNKNSTTANLTISGGTISNNSANYGGGVYCDGVTLKINGGTIGASTKEGANHVSLNGGGVYLTNSNATQDAGSITNNTANQNGGGVYVTTTASYLLTNNGAITYNTTTTTNFSYGYGGGIYSGGTLTQSGGNILGNSSIYGGGVFLGNNTTAKFTQSGGYIGNPASSSTANTAVRNGGGVYVSANATLTKTGGAILSNKALGTEGTSYGFGGGVACMGTFSMTTNTSNSISQNSAYCGGGVAIYGTSKTFTFSAGTISSNTVTGNGGGVNIGGTHTLVMNNANAIISGNTATNATNGLGGGVNMSAGTFNFTAGHLRNNSARRGGGVYYGGGTFTFNGGTIGGISGTTSYGNSATQYGGGVYLNTGWTPTRGTISYNTAGNSTSTGGGGVCVGSGTFTLNTTNVTISNNSAHIGGGVLVYGGTFTMSSGNLRSNSANSYGGGVCVVNSANFTLSGGTIGGSGYGNSASQGGGVFVNSTGTVNLSGGTISYNSASSGGGGGVYLYSGTVTQRNTVSNNSATTSGTATGGGVYLRAGTYNLPAGSISSNSVANSSTSGISNGGGVYIAGGTFTLNGGTISNNAATGAPGTHSGGGIYLNGGALNISSGYVTGNSAVVNSSSDHAYGGGVYANGGTFTLSGGYLRSNSAANDGGGVYAGGSATVRITGGTIGGSSSYANDANVGGGLYVNTSTAVTFSGGTISYNTATSGGGINLYQARTLNMSGTAIVANNSASGNGGGIYVNGSQTTTAKTTVNLSGGQIYSNTAVNGGGIYMAGANAVLDMTGGTIGGTSTTYANKATTNGGGIYNGAGTLTFSAGTVSYNTATYAGGIHTAGTTSLTGTAVVSNNTASSSGGGISVYGNTLTINGENVEIKNNISNVTTAGYGGGVFINSGTVTLTSGNLINNNSTYGGGVFVNAGTLTVNGGKIDGNTAIRNGGGVMVNPNGTFNMSGGTISNNAAKNTDPSGTQWGWGGGVGGSGRFTMTDGTITNNTAATYGGGVGFYNPGVVSLQGGKITANEAYGGGGVAVNQGATMNIAGVTVTDNTATKSGGGAYVMGGAMTVTDGVISNNTAAHAGGVYVASGTLSVAGGEITANESTDPEGVGVHVVDGATLELGGTAYIYDNLYRGYQNNVFVESEQSVTFSDVLEDGAKIGIIAIEDFVLTDGFTTAGHTQADVEKYFSSDIHGLTLKYENDEIVVTYDFETAWNETVQASLDNGTTELFILYKDWTAENGSFGDSSGVGFYGTGTILVPDQASVIFDFNDKTVDGAGATATIMRVEGELVFDTYFGGTMTGGNSSDGGAVYVSGGSLTLKKGSIKGNTASYGGGVYINDSGSFLMEGGEIFTNTAERGGGVYVADGEFNLTGGLVGNGGEDKNTATTYGGGVYVAGGGIFNMEKAGDDICAISGNTAQRGAGVYVDGGKFTLTSGVIVGNTATDGGAIYVDSGSVELNGGEIGNAAVNTAENGAGLYVTGGDVTLDGVKIIGNTATNNGSGVYVAGGNVVMSDGEISGNKAEKFGGGVYITGTSSQFTLSGGAISENTATNGLGVYVDGGTLTVTDSGVITKHTSTTANGAGVYLVNGTLNVTGGNISANKAALGGGVYVAGGDFRLSDDGAIVSNTAENGAGVYIAGGVSNISGGNIGLDRASNVATENGGGVYVLNGALNIRGGSVGYNEAKNGAGVYVGYVGDGSGVGALTLTGNGAIKNNVATENGGGVYAGGALTMAGGEISGNKATTGAGINVSGEFEMTGGEISGNAATGVGGGVRVEDGSFTMTDGTITANTAASGGGVSVNEGQGFEMNGGSISDNTVSQLGGGVHVDGYLELNGGTISGNTAVSGGGVYIGGNSDAIKINGGEISGNKAQNGAGVYLDRGKTLDIENGVITGNTATGATTNYGGGLYVNINAVANISEAAEITLNAATLGGGVYVNEGIVNLVSGAISENSASSGGGIYINAGSVEMTGGSIIKNNSTDATETAGGGGVFVSNGAFTVSGNSKINENTSARNGGGIRIDGATDSSTVEITSGSLSDNTAAVGGGAYVTGNFAALTLNGSVTVSDNKATTNGGAIAALVGATVDVTGNAFVTKNTATLNGGAVYLSDAGTELNVSDKGAITYNTATYGGGVYATASSAFTLIKGSLSFNEAATNGGAMYVNGATFVIEDGEVLGNKATTNGGAVYVAAGTTSAFTMTGGAIGGEDSASNTAALGGGVYIAGGNIIITAGSISGNTATTNGGGVYFNAGTLSFEGTPVISGNKLQDSDSNLYLYNGKTVKVTGKFNTGAHIGLTGTGKVTEDYTANGNGEDEKKFFSADVVGAVVAIVNGEIHLQISLESAWNAAVQASYDNGGKAVTFVLAETWRAESDGSFGEGIGFTDSGALYLPQGSYIILNLNGYTINRNLGTVTAEGSVFYVKGTLEISGTTGYITGGNAENGGGVYVQEDGSFKMTVGNIQNNIADANGGGVYVESGANFEFTDGAIRGNRAVSGGAVYVENGGEFTMKGGVIGGTGYANTATYGAGVYTAGTSKLSGGYIRNNAATTDGGAVYVADGEFVADGGYIGGTAASFANTAENGAGVYLAGGEFYLEGATVAYNEAESGGGVYVSYGTLKLSDGIIANNTAVRGGGIYTFGTVEMSGGSIRSNTSTPSDGGGVFQLGGTFEMTGGTIGGNGYANNGASGGGVYIAEGSFIMNGEDAAISYNVADSTDYGNGGGIVVGTGTFNLISGKVSNNTATSNGGGILVEAEGKANLNGGEISNNTAANFGGVLVFGTVEMNGGKISGNKTTGTGTSGGGLHVAGEGSFTMNGGEISGNVASNGAGVSVWGGGAFEMNGGSITRNTATLGGGVCVYSEGSFTMNGGEICKNTATYGSGVYVQSGAAFTMADGEISSNSSDYNGGGIFLDGNSTFEMNGGLISDNFASENGGGVYVHSNAVFTMTDGEISDNEADYGAGVYVFGKLTFTGGEIINNSAATLGGGVYVAQGATFEVSGSPIISGNTADGVENNVYLTEEQVIVIIGTLSVNGMIAWIGVTMEKRKRFTSGFTTNNGSYTPALKPETVFFSDDTDYKVSLEDGEATLTDNDYSQTSLVWQFNKGDGNWITIDAPEYSIRYRKDEEYTVRALDVNGEVVAFTWAKDGDNNDITGAFKGIGSYKFVINSDEYTNPSLTFEILPAQLIWQYSTDSGLTWRDLTGNTMVYTGEDYTVRACVYNNGTYEPVALSTGNAMKDVGSYEFNVTDLDLYENHTLNYTITTRYITVEWNFSDALGNETDGYYWEYDGLAHSPVAVLDGVSGNLAGVDLSYDYARSGSTTNTPDAQAYAGTYTLTVALKNSDANIVLSNTSVQYKINGVTLSLVWTDEEGNEGEEFTFEYDNEPHGLKYKLSGVVTGDTVEPQITYSTRSGKDLIGAPTAVGFYTATVKLPKDCYNYVFDKVYTCQIEITQKSIAVEWTPNSDGTFEWTFNGLGQGPTANVINPYTGLELNEAYKIEYAPVASNGNIGQYVTTKPVDAGNYVVRITLNNPDANYVLDEETTTQNFTIKKLDVEVTWKGAAYDEDKDVYFWEYDGNQHDLEAEISLIGLGVYKNGAILDYLGIERTDNEVKLVTVGSATATVVLLNDPFNANFNITNSTSQVYEVRKAVISSVDWTDKFMGEYATGDEPVYDFGTVSGLNGPAFEALGNGKVSLVVTYDKTYAGDWVVDETVGYIAYARLSAADAANYEFAEGAEYSSITFFIKSVGGFKTSIDVTWVVFVNDYDYVTLDQYINDGGFVYNGNVQSPTPIYVKDNGDVVRLDQGDNNLLNPNSIGADAGDYTARLNPSNVYNIKKADLTCEYTIKKLDISISWQDGQYDSNTTFTYVYNGSEQAPYAYVDGTYDFDIEVTVKGKTNAGTYPATATVSKNFNITSGKTQTYTISKLGLPASLVEWDWNDASGNADDGYYWIYGGNTQHAPTAKIPAKNWGGDYDLILVVTGATSEIGKHNAYAVLNSSVASHNNFYLTGTASVPFEITQVKVDTVYWEDAEGNSYEDGTADATKLVFTYNGNFDGQAPKAYYVDADGKKVYLDVTVIGGKAVNAGTYTAYVSSDLDFDSDMPTCTFKIKAMEITVTWDDTTDLVFNGDKQSPAVTLSNGADSNALVKGTDYEITGYTDAGKYTFEIKFINTNYTCADAAKTFEFEIKKITLTNNEYAWDTTDGYDADENSYSWIYDGDKHAPVLTVNYDLDGDGVDDVVFEIGYIGKTSEVGTHKVTAYIKSATYDGKDIKANFAFDTDMDMEYVIKAISVTIEWVLADDNGTVLTATTGDDGSTYYEWTYGTTVTPKAYLKDANGNRIKNDSGDDITLTVYGMETNARKEAYTLTAVVPSEYGFSGDATYTYFIKPATIEVNWDFTGATQKVDGDGNTYYEWIYGTSVTPKAYVKVTATDDQGNTTVTNGDELQVSVVETDAGTHTLTVMHNDGNYAFANASDASMRYVITPKTAYVIWFGVDGYDETTGVGDTTNFEWPFVDSETAIAPTAYLAYKDTNGDLQLILDENGKAIKVEVSGKGTEIGSHTAQAVDTFVNYDFDNSDPAAYRKDFEVLAKDLEVEWSMKDATKTVDEQGKITFTFEYSGENNVPVPSSDVDDLEFNVTIVKVETDGTTKPVLVITDAGKYEVTVASRDGNYEIPSTLETVTVVVNPKKVAVKWNKELTYNGENQKPKAYYEDVAHNDVELTVTVTGDSKDAGVTYSATATLSSTNYVLDAETTTTTFEIAQKEIEVKCTWTDIPYDGEGHRPEIEIVATDIADITISYEITDKDGKVVATDGQKVKDAGVYKISFKLGGAASGNYKLSGDKEYTFTIDKRDLTVTAKDKTVTYGDTVKVENGDFEYEFTGLVADGEKDVDAIKAELADVIRQWLICSYINTSEPGTYPIQIGVAYLNKFLANYNVTGVNGTLTVDPAEGKLVWKADRIAEDGTPVFAYDKAANLPAAYYYDANLTRHDLAVKYATFDGTEYTVVADPAYEAVEVGTYYAVIVDTNGNVIKGDGNYTFSNYGIKFQIEKRKITVNVKDLTFTYGDLTDDNLANVLDVDNGWTYGDILPVQGDNLEIILKLSGIDSAYDNGGYLASGKYAISVEWNDTVYGNSYEIEVKYEGEHDLTVKDATITVNYDKKDETVYDAYGILEGTNGYTSDFITDTKDFLELAGYQDAAVTAYFKLVDDSNIAPEDDHYGADVDPITAEGEYLFNFMISVDNHETLYGRLLVKVGYADDYLYITVTGKTLEKTYGYETADDLAKYLIENGYAEYDEKVNTQVSKADFLEMVTATVVDQDGNEVSGKLGVGTYKVIFGLKEHEGKQYSIYKASSRFVTLEITKYVIEIDWGNEENLNYTYDGETHMPVITVAGLTDESGNPITLQVGENEITIGGEKVKVIVTVDGDLTEAGAHSVLVTVISDNFEVKENNALRSVSINDPAEVQPVVGGLEDWQLWLIIAAAIVLAAIIIALVIVLVKRRQASDDDGFYDPVDESDL